jgi:hypothetical protein
MYEYHDSAAAEQPGSASLRALQGVPILSDSFIPVLDSWSLALVAEEPALAAPEAEAVAAAGEQPAARQGRAEQVAAQVAALLPPAACEQAPEPGCSEQAGGGAPQRTRYQALLDRSKQQLHDEALAQHGAKVAAHNKQLAKPGQHGLP